MREVYDIFLDGKAQQDFNYYYKANEETPIEGLPNFNTINIFVGANNSGKSRFMRTLMKQAQIKGVQDYISLATKIERYNKLIEALDIKWEQDFYKFRYLENHRSVPNAEILNVLPVRVKYIDILNRWRLNFDQNFKTLEIVKQIIDNNLLSAYNRSGNRQPVTILESFYEQLQKAISISEQIINEISVKELGRNQHYFIPTLRTAHSLFEQSTENPKIHLKHQGNIYADTLIKNYSLQNRVTKDFSGHIIGNDKAKIVLFTGLNLYSQIVNVRNGPKIERKRFEDFEKFIGKNFFNTESIEIVAHFNYEKKHSGKDDEEIINILIGEGQEDGRNLYELGDGIQALIILMYGIFMAPDNTIIFIDEPELNLHPGMQRLFLEQITTNKALTDKKLHYVIATHSNHLLDLTLAQDNVSIYWFSKEKDDRFVIRNTNAGDNALLRELGVNNSSVFLANCSIWVEGISDRNYIKAWLIAYCAAKEKPMPKEDIDFAFLEYAGSNLEHYEFGEEDNASIKAYALNNRVFVIADNDTDKESKHAKYQQLCKLNPENFIYETTAPYREVENLLSNAVWEKVLIELCHKTKVETDKATIENEIAQKVSSNNINNFKDEYIGKYLSKLKIAALNDVYEGSKTNPKTLKSKYKTFLSKTVLEKTIVGEIKWADFSNENERVVALTEAIYNFIMRNGNQTIVEEADQGIDI